MLVGVYLVLKEVFFMRFEQLKQSLKEEVFPVYLLEGEDGFFRMRGAELIKNKCLQEPSLNYTKVEGTTLKTGLDSVIADLKVCPFMSEKRIVEVSEWYPTAADLKQKSVKEYFESPSDTSVLIIVNSSSSDALKKQKNVTLVDCKKADEAIICRYIKGQATKAGVNVTQPVCMKIAEYCLNDMTRISKETEKLIDYAYESKEITDEAVELLVAKEVDYKTYEIVEFIARRDFKNAYKVLEDISTPSEKQILFVSLYYQLR
ncbi:MAG TPA: hypothetical protein DDY77_05025, partial [Clostridiales bacterium]|nr:hypothetical protein [Clostridiales bacterium]